MKGLEAKSCVYRFNRDIRFSNDKSPYKSHFGAFIVKGGKKNGDKYAGYYFHIEPGAKAFWQVVLTCHHPHGWQRSGKR